MKANVSIPHSVAQAAERLAKQLDVSISELYTAALSSYVTSHQEDVTDALNRVYTTEPSTLDPELVKVQVALLEGEEW
ncbi:MAG: hypothetical protein WA821_02970 [Anaerolineales bacterium]